MTSAPVADQHQLLVVQDLDTRLDQIAHRRREVPALATIVALDARLADLGTALVTSRTAAGDLRRELAKAEADVEQVRARATRDQGRLDSGQSSVKDTQALTSEIDHLAGRQAALEEVELDVMERLEAHTAVLDELEAAHAEVERQRAAAEAERDAAFAALDDEAAQVRAERAAAVDGLDAGLVTLYEKLRGQLSGRGAAALVGRQCQGCRMELNPADLDAIKGAPPQQVVRCEECGRILVRTGQ
ncbi:MAG TPA: C4-type zinc ribbon domain-containing protein [Cellulomonas sp.]